MMFIDSGPVRGLVGIHDATHDADSLPNDADSNYLFAFCPAETRAAQTER